MLIWRKLGVRASV